MAWLFWNEIGRKLIHITILIVLWVYFLIEKAYNKQVALIALVLLLIIFIILEYFRLELGWKMPYFSHFIRPKEEHRMYGVIYFLSATIICLAVFDAHIALAALLMTTFGDMVAALAGKKWGQTILFKNKTLVGFNAELLTNLLVGFFVLENIYIIIGMAITATAVETLVDELDDNLLIPLFAGFVGQLIFYSI
jgi:dolichol kinase